MLVGCWPASFLPSGLLGVGGWEKHLDDHEGIIMGQARGAIGQTSNPEPNDVKPDSKGGNLVSLCYYLGQRAAKGSLNCFIPPVKTKPPPAFEDTFNLDVTDYS